jgi:hypothetical protein
MAGSLYVFNTSAFAVKLLRGAMHLIEKREKSNEKISITLGQN